MKSLNYLNAFLEKEDKTTKKTLRSLEKDFRLYERSFNLLCKTLMHICNSTKKKLLSTQKEAVLFITPRIIQSLQSIRVLNSRGYYYDVAIIERSLFESMGLCSYLALNKEEAENWLEAKDVKIAKIKLFDQIGKLLVQKELPEVGMKRVYGLLSQHVHTDFQAVFSLVSLRKTPAVGLRYFPAYDKERVREIASYPTLMLWILAEIFEDELTKGRKTKIHEFIEQYKREKE